MSTTTTNSTDRVLIIGGGISGLCLAQGLKKHGIPFTVFERDESPTSRPQGFRVRINGEGLAALEASLPDDLLELFHKSNAIFEQGFAFHDPITGEKKTSQWQQPKHPGTAGEGKMSEWKQPQQPPATGETKLPQRHQPPTGGNLHRGPSFASDRATLRAVLAANLTEDELRYGMSFKTYRLRPDSSGIEVKFENGEVVSGALVIGADGTNSRVRKSYLWEETELLDTDGRIIYGKTPLTPELEAVFPPEALRTTSLATDTNPHMSLFSEPMRFSPETREFVAANGLEPVDDYLYWAVVARSETFDRARRPEDQVEQLTPEQLRDLVLRVTEHWSPNLRVAFEQQALGFGAMLKIATMNPKIKPWKPTRATLMGDAIHAMTPAGIGANVALKDAAVLLKSILEHGVSIEAVGVYEEQMREYATHAITMSFGAGRKMFGQPEVEDMKTIE